MANAFAADNNGVTAQNLTEQNLMGKTLTDYLPDATLLENPYTSESTNPTYGTASEQGEVAYAAVEWEGGCWGYYITGFGDSGIVSQIFFKPAACP